MEIALDNLDYFAIIN